MVLQAFDKPFDAITERSATPEEFILKIYFRRSVGTTPDLFCILILPAFSYYPFACLFMLHDYAFCVNITFFACYIRLAIMDHFYTVTFNDHCAGGTQGLASPFSPGN